MLPIIVLVVFSFSDDRLVGRWGGFTFGWYEAFWNDRGAHRFALPSRCRSRPSSTLISVVLGTLVGVQRWSDSRFRGQRVFDALLYLPIIIPDVTMGIMMLIFFAEAHRDSSRGTYESIFGEPLSKGIVHTITLSHIAFNISFVSVVVRARSVGHGHQSRGGGDGPLRERGGRPSRRVTFPQILPGIIGGALLAITLSLDDVVVTQFSVGAGRDHLARLASSALIRKGVTPVINAVSVVMLVASLALVVIIARRRTGYGRVPLAARVRTTQLKCNNPGPPGPDHWTQKGNHP